MATLEQMRAAFALEKIDSITSNPGKFKTQLLKLPARLHNNGLGQTVAFYLTVGSGKPEWIICEWLQDWLSRSIEVGPGIYPPSTDLIRCVSGQGLDPRLDAELLYRRASDEVRAVSVWLKRFAEAFLKGSAE